MTPPPKQTAATATGMTNPKRLRTRVALLAPVPVPEKAARARVGIGGLIEDMLAQSEHHRHMLRHAKESLAAPPSGLHALQLDRSTLLSQVVTA